MTLHGGSGQDRSKVGNGPYEKMIDTAKFLKKSLPSQCITDSTVLPGRVVINPILANVPITSLA